MDKLIAIIGKSLLLGVGLTFVACIVWIMFDKWENKK